MKVFNLTDVETRQLRYQGLAGCPIKDLYGVVIPPGEYRVVRDTPANRKHLQQQYVGRDALSMDRVPADYAGTAAEKGPPQVSLPSPAPPSPTESHPETPPPDTQPPDTQPAPGSDEGEESRPKRKKRGSRRG